MIFIRKSVSQRQAKQQLKAHGMAQRKKRTARRKRYVHPAIARGADGQYLLWKRGICLCVFHVILQRHDFILCVGSRGVGHLWKICEQVIDEGRCKVRRSARFYPIEIHRCEKHSGMMPAVRPRLFNTVAVWQRAPENLRVLFAERQQFVRILHILILVHALGAQRCPKRHLLFLCVRSCEIGEHHLQIRQPCVIIIIYQNPPRRRAADCCQQAHIARKLLCALVFVHPFEIGRISLPREWV